MARQAMLSGPPVANDSPHGKEASADDDRASLRAERTRAGPWVARWRRGVLVAIGLVFLALTAAFVANWPPLSAPWLRDRVAEALQGMLPPGHDLRLGAVTLAPADRAIHLTVLAITPPPGMPSLHIEALAVTLDVPALLRGALMPRSVRADGVTLALPRVTAAEGGASVQPAVSIEGWGRGWPRELDALAIERLRIVDAHGRDIVTARAEMTRQRADAWAFRATGEAAGTAWRMGATLEAAEQGLSRIALEGEGLPLTWPGAIDPALSALMGRFSADVLAEADEGGRWRRATLRMAVAEPTLALPHQPPVALDRLAVTAQWSGAAEVRLQAVEAVRGAMRLEGSGTVTVDDEGAILALDVPRPRFQPVRGEEPVAFDQLNLLARLDRPASIVTVERLALIGGQRRASLSGRLARAPEGLSLDLALTAAELPVPDALALWPVTAAPEARRALRDQAADGKLASLDLRLAMPAPVLADAWAQRPLPPESVALSARVTGGSLAPLPGGPRLVRLDGALAMDARSLTATNVTGAVEAEGAAMDIRGAEMRLGPLDRADPVLSMRGSLRGGLEAAMRLLAHPKINRWDGPAPDGLSGQLDARLAFRIALRADGSAGDPVVEGDGTILRLRGDTLVAGERLEAPELRFRLSGSQFRLEGEGRWAGLPATLALARHVTSGAGEGSLVLTVDEAERQRRGLPARPSLAGPLAIRAQASFPGGARPPRVLITADLGANGIDGLLPGVRKPAGRPGRLAMRLEPRGGGGHLLRDITFEAAGALLRGEGEIGPGGQGLTLRLPQVRISPGDAVHIDYSRVGNLSRAVVRGANLDSRPFLASLTRPAPPGATERDLDLDLRTDVLSGHHGELITHATLRLRRSGGLTRELRFAGRLEGKPIEIGGSSSDGSPAVLSLNGGDAGGMLRFFDIYPRLRGGELLGRITPQPGGKAEGFITVRDFALRDEPAIRRLVAQAPREAGRILPERDVPFTKLRADFVRRGADLRIAELTIFGPEIGLLLNGLVETERDRVSLSGTFVPAFGLNNMFAQIPLLGPLLGGGRNEGLLGVTFGVSGRLSQPTVTVNPLSAVAPGIFRRIFEFSNETTPRAPAP